MMFFFEEVPPEHHTEPSDTIIMYDMESVPSLKSTTTPAEISVSDSKISTTIKRPFVSDQIQFTETIKRTFSRTFSRKPFVELFFSIFFSTSRIKPSKEREKIITNHMNQ